MAQRLPAPPKPADISDDEALEVVAKVGAFTSAEVVAADESLHKAMSAFSSEVQIQMQIEYQRSGKTDSIGAAYEVVEAKRTEVRARYDEVVAAIRHELTMVG